MAFSNPAAPTLILHLNETTGTVAADATGNLDAYYVGAGTNVILAADTIVGNCPRFHVNSIFQNENVKIDYHPVKTPAYLDITNQWAIRCWLKPEGNNPFGPGIETVFEFGGYSNNDLGIWLRHDTSALSLQGRIRIGSAFAGTNYFVTWNHGGAFTDGNPHDIIFQYNGSHLQIYMEEVLMAETAVTGHAQEPAIAFSLAKGQSAGWSTWWDGLIDEFYFYPAAFANTETKSHLFDALIIDQEGLFEPSNVSLSRHPWKRVDWFPFEAVRSDKMNQMGHNQSYLSGRKIDGFISNKDALDRTNLSVPTPFSKVEIYAEYREISTDENDELTQINKTIKFFKVTDINGDEQYIFDDNLPVVFSSVGIQGKVDVRRIATVVNNPDQIGYEAHFDSLALGESRDAPAFGKNDNYFLNTIAFGTSDVSYQTPYAYEGIDWGTAEDELQLTSEKLNQMKENQQYLYDNRVSPFLVNMNFETKGVDPGITLLTDDVIMYGEYLEFNPDFGKTEKNKETTTSFTIDFDFPDLIFNPNYQPVVIANVGVPMGVRKNNGEEPDNVRKIGSVLKKVRPTGFTLLVYEFSGNKDFAENNIYFVTYIVVGRILGGWRNL